MQHFVSCTKPTLQQTMFGFFNKKNKQPSYRVLWTFEKRNHYFTRNAEWGWLDKNTTFVNHPKTLETLFLTDWQQFIFLAANGQMTVAAYVHHVASQYTTAVPEELDQNIIYELLALSDEKLIVFSAEPCGVPEPFEGPLLK